MSLAILVIAVAATIAAAVIEHVRDRSPGGRIARLLDLHDHAENAARARRNACDRCTTGNLQLPCACDTDCYAAMCLGWLDDEWRAMIRGDAR